MSKQEKLDSTIVDEQHKDSVSSEDETKVQFSNIEEKTVKPLAKEYNGPKGLEPTRYGDWESKGRCYDF
jgi:hypothetical protein